MRKLVEEHKLDPAAIAGTGRDGRITKGDVLDYIADHQATTVGIEHDVLAAPASPSPAPAAAAGVARNEQRVPMTRLRARIAERLVQAQQHSRDADDVQRSRHDGRHGAARSATRSSSEKHGVKLGFMSFFVKACDRGAAAVPGGQRVGRRQRHRLSRVLRHRRRGVDRRGLDRPGAAQRRAHELRRHREGDPRLRRARAQRRAQIEELTGGTFTITNGGMFGSLMSTPILNPPQSAILGMHKIQERPMVVDGKIEVRPMMYLALTYDHRIIDGREAVQFLVPSRTCSRIRRGCCCEI